MLRNKGEREMRHIEDIRIIEKATEVRFHLGGPFYIDGRECLEPIKSVVIAPHLVTFVVIETDDNNFRILDENLKFYKTYRHEIIITGRGR
jgi:hypothetical protein